MWTPLRQLRRDLYETQAKVNRAADRTHATASTVEDGFVRYATNFDVNVVDLNRRYNRLADTIEAAVIVLCVVAVACTVATTIKELVSE